MKAITRPIYGGPEVLQIEDIAKPTIKPDQVLVAVKANGLNPADWHLMRGEPYFMRFIFGLFKPKKKDFGSDFAGVVSEVGANVKSFKVGERIFGEASGAFAEYIAVSPKVCGRFSKEQPFQTMAAVPIAGQTAYQAITTYGKVKKGERVLINGSSGGVGHFMVQIAKQLGAHVTAICSARNKAFVESLGADAVLPYDEIDIQNHQGHYDLIIDNHGNLNFSDYQRMGKRGVMVGFTTMTHMIKLSMTALFKRYAFTSFTAEPNTKDLEVLAKMIEDKTLKVEIQKVYDYTDIPAAIGYLEQMKTRGKLVATWYG